MSWILRIFRVACLAILSTVLLTFLAVQFQQRLLRHRAEHLMSDMHQIRIYRSTWADAEKLMNRWGAWGQYDGTCTAAECRYQIALTDLSYAKFGWLMQHGGFRIYSWFGGRAARLSASFTVRDGTIWRKTADISVTASRKLLSADDDFPLTLIVQTKSRQRLRRTEDDWWIMGDDDQLAEHPYYKAGRPGGCKVNCEMAVVTYSTRTPPPEIDRLTSFNLSCLTQFSSCTELEQLLPAAKDWHLYQERDSAMQQTASRPCNDALWAIARDTRYALIVKGLSKRTAKVPGFAFIESKNTFEKGPDFNKEEALVKVLTPLKGPAPWAREAVVPAYPYGGTEYYPATPEAAEHLLPGTRYILFPVGEVLTKQSPIELDRCGVWEDTAANRRELEKGFAQNDDLRRSELR